MPTKDQVSGAAGHVAALTSGNAATVDDWHATSTLHSSCNAPAGLFAGAALFISAVEHPAAMETDVKAFYRYFPHMYKR
jgi:hypothetical protein